MKLGHGHRAEAKATSLHFLQKASTPMQDRSQLGNRFTCFECGKKFYDLNKPEPVCPTCGANQAEDPTPDPRVAVMERYKGSRMTAADAAPSKAAFAVEDTMEEEGPSDIPVPDMDDDTMSGDVPVMDDEAE